MVCEMLPEDQNPHDHMLVHGPMVAQSHYHTWLPSEAKNISLAQVSLPTSVGGPPPPSPQVAHISPHITTYITTGGIYAVVEVMMNIRRSAHLMSQGVSPTQ